MATAPPLPQSLPEKRQPVLNTVDRVTELCFGLFMALTFVGAVKAVGAGDDAGRKLFFTALGCNLAWGLADAVMFIVRNLADRGQRLTLASAVKRDANRASAVQTLRDALPASLEPLVDDAELELIRARLAARTTLPPRARFIREDFVGALGVFLLVVVATFPVALPFLLIGDRTAALVISRVLTLLMLFVAGFALGRYTGGGALKTGFVMTLLGIALTVAIILLGG
ncbi:VIT1/CCC1 transporter family protein [Paraburkholderia sp. MMS20-SJTR3]|uniref:VIT1/CCC1 transporter family protein n=1 Tax=Paraburkholderia sejongensis TaxID=2886946 RepID=A0ABS8K351_9BURK|nr:VIT1/CCC1 transporter family protein [Paraburkholderia sp. MMS20-SJTR3]MCC8396561.1 VIT1/CCC1 transporter family protein [Paraburkholderia sp. MMS20-SJTR3]